MLLASPDDQKAHVTQLTMKISYIDLELPGEMRDESAERLRTRNIGMGLNCAENELGSTMPSRAMQLPKID
jgi:hypothetical protein